MMSAKEGWKKMQQQGKRKKCGYKKRYKNQTKSKERNVEKSTSCIALNRVVQIYPWKSSGQLEREERCSAIGDWTYSNVM